MRLEFTINNSININELLSSLKENINTVPAPPQQVQRTCYDTFDWRVYSSKAVLEAEINGKHHELLWRSLSDSGQRIHVALTRAPRFAGDIPPGQLHDILVPVLEMRELVPLVHISTRVHTLRVMDKIEKTVARILVEENRIRQRKGGKIVLHDNRVIVIPVKGYQKACKRVVKTLGDMNLSQTTEDLILKALAVTGHQPGNYTSKLELQLDPAMRADQATRNILLRLLDIIEDNEAGTRRGTDTEFLHDFRVAVRRTRSALTQIKGVLPAPVLNRYKREFAWLGQITTPSRDLDVYLLQFDDYKHSLPESAQADIEPLREFLLRHQAIEHKALLKGLNSARYRRLTENWRRFLTQPVAERSTLANAKRPVIEVACERIWRVYRRILKEGRGITPDSPAEALHELRKTGKKLRYLIEFFQSLFPDNDVKALIKTLKQLQDNLGDFQDYEVQVMTLRKFSQQMVVEDAAPAETLLAMGMLIEGLERRQHAARDEFATRFANFAQQENQDHFRQLFFSPADTQGETP
ncbi:MAG TPA: CHAD domain-containing protein [Gammaproteobacteria bacterium]|nr:CHAD domain-containing protein [Gammaproteobacteria bacterium]